MKNSVHLREASDTNERDIPGGNVNWVVNVDDNISDVFWALMVCGFNNKYYGLESFAEILIGIEV